MSNKHFLLTATYLNWSLLRGGSGSASRPARRRRRLIWLSSLDQKSFVQQAELYKQISCSRRRLFPNSQHPGFRQRSEHRLPFGVSNLRPRAALLIKPDCNLSPPPMRRRLPHNALFMFFINLFFLKPFFKSLLLFTHEYFSGLLRKKRERNRPPSARRARRNGRRCFIAG